MFVLSFSSRVHSQPLFSHTCVLRLPKQLTVHKPEQLSKSIYKVRVWGGRKMPSKSPRAGQSSTTAQDTTDVNRKGPFSFPTPGAVPQLLPTLVPGATSRTGPQRQRSVWAAPKAGEVVTEVAESLQQGVPKTGYCCWRDRPCFRPEYSAPAASGPAESEGGPGALCQQRCGHLSTGRERSPGHLVWPRAH